MPQFDATDKGNLAASLAAGIASISENASTVFTEYTQVRVAPDGYLFWVAGSTQTFTGSMHVAADVAQNEDETVAVNDVVFTTAEEIQQFNQVDPRTFWAATVPADGGEIVVAFRARGSFYEPAQVWHYRGTAVFPALQAQLVRSATDIPSGPIVSNSLPIWLTQDGTAPVYPSFLVPENAEPPYIVAHIEPGRTEALGAFPALETPPVPQPGDSVAPMYGWTTTQLLRDSVRLTLYGLTNQQATQFYMNLIDYSLATDAFGFCNSPVLRDDKRTQPEITAIAMKKTLEIEASYYLNTADALARRYILSAGITTNP